MNSKDYLEVSIRVQPFSEESAEIVEAFVAELPFDSFVVEDPCLKCYIQASLFEPAALEEALTACGSPSWTSRAVQGENCPGEVINGINYFTDKNNVDVIIIARGGGSIEDLWGFNNEELARTVFACPIPVISAIGHETDYTILDHVADKRSPTPTAAAEDVIKTYEELSNANKTIREKLVLIMKKNLSQKRAALDALRSNKALFTPELVAAIKRNELNNLIDSLNRNEHELIDSHRRDLNSYIDRLGLLGPHNVLRRGYSYVTLSDGTPVVSVNSVNKDSKVNIVFNDGNANAVITEVFGEDK